MKTQLTLTTLLIAAVLLGCTINAADEKKNDWTILFDGTNADAWRSGNSPTLPDKWKIEDGALMFDPSIQGKGGDILTKTEYSDFELELEFKMTQGANSGIKYYFANGLGLEYQILDDANHPDAKNGQNGNRTLASLYDLIAARADKPVKPIGEWNTARIVAKNDTIQHWLNGKLVLEFTRGSDAYNQLVAISKYKDAKGFGMAPKGPILLQDHGDKVWYRNIRIRPL
jgi:hypothetical protein